MRTHGSPLPTRPWWAFWAWGRRGRASRARRWKRAWDWNRAAAKCVGCWIPSSASEPSWPRCGAPTTCPRACCGSPAPPCVPPRATPAAVTSGRSATSPNRSWPTRCGISSSTRPPTSCARPWPTSRPMPKRSRLRTWTSSSKRPSATRSTTR